MSPSVRSGRLVSGLVGRSICHNFRKGWGSYHSLILLEHCFLSCHDFLAPCRHNISPFFRFIFLLFLDLFSTSLLQWRFWPSFIIQTCSFVNIWLLYVWIHLFFSSLFIYCNALKEYKKKCFTLGSFYKIFFMYQTLYFACIYQ